MSQTSKGLNGHLERVSLRQEAQWGTSDGSSVGRTVTEMSGIVLPLRTRPVGPPLPPPLAGWNTKAEAVQSRPLSLGHLWC